MIGTTYGSGADGGTFKLPDLRQKFPMGKAASGTGATLGGTGGTLDASISAPAHTHTLDLINNEHGKPYLSVAGDDSYNWRIVIYTLNWGGGTASVSPTTTSAGGGASIVYNPPFQTVNYIIKY
mgnify:CR=1 FL=1